MTSSKSPVVFSKIISTTHNGAVIKSRVLLGFFDDDTDDYIHAVYAGVNIDTLQRKKKYSIEHIIPKSFLKSYLSNNNNNEEIIKGSTTNPLNFAACHRNINSARRNWPFDVEDDRIVRSYTINMEGIYSDFGFDDENEWVVPIRSQGDIARSILYMCLIYDINELYGEHLNIYRRWAKVDPPNIWELKYNEWVHQKLGIRNPFVADYNNPVQAFQLLDDNELMDSILLS
ncbi:endonuclease [Aliamphritea spongicola]|nr:endonuclease [Aliamphritea spongicola]